LPPAAERRSLCSLNFSRDRKRPVRVDNEAKACLDDVALTLNREASARLAITGERSSEEDPGQAAARARNARQYLTAEKGIDPARIDIKTGTLSARAAEVELLPVGTPIRYTDDATGAAAPQPAATRSSPPASATPGTVDQPMTSASPAPASNAVGGSAFGPKRSPDSLVLPPLPADAIAGNRTHRTRRAAATTRPRPRTARHRRRRRRKAASTSAPAAAAPATPPQ
jgi:hypothetical protein